MLMKQMMGYLPRKSDVECFITSDERSQFSKRLFARTTHSDQKDVSTGMTKNTGNLVEALAS